VNEIKTLKKKDFQLKKLDYHHQEELDQEIKRLNAIISGFPIPQFVIDKDHKVTHWNDALEKASSIPSRQVIGTDTHWKAFYSTKRPCLADLCVDESFDEIPELYEGKYNKSKLIKGAYEAVDFFPALGEDGKWLYFTASLIKDSEGQVLGAVETLEDITKNKLLEAELIKSLQEKETLLKEIHHRVKNNLLMISSLLSLQSSYIKDKKDLNIFRECENRANSMALIHEQLYRSTDLQKIDFGNYIISLVGKLFQAYSMDPHVKLNINNVEDIMLDIDIAIPLALILNELVSNSMKHAFPPGESGEIDVEFYGERDRLQNDQYVLIVADDGVGLPEDLDYRKTNSLGLQLVNSFTKQIDGKIDLNTSQGTSFKIIIS